MSSIERGGDSSFAEKNKRFMQLYEPLHRSLERFARTMTGSREEARDLVSETVLLAFEGFERLRDRDAFLSFLFTIARRLHRKHHRRKERFGTYDEEQVAAIRDNGPMPDARVDVERLYTALAELPERQREAVVLFEISGLSLEEIRTIQGGTLSGVKTRLVRGRRRLAELLGADDPRSDAVDRAEQCTVSESRRSASLSLSPRHDDE